MDSGLKVTLHGALIDSRPKVTPSYGALTDSEPKATFRTAWSRTPCRKEAFVMDSELKATSLGALMDSRPKVTSSYDALMASELKVTFARRGQRLHAAGGLRRELGAEDHFPRSAGSELKVAFTRGTLMDSRLKVTSSHGVVNDSMPQEAFVTDLEL